MVVLSSKLRITKNNSRFEILILLVQSVTTFGDKSVLRVNKVKNEVIRASPNPI
jgi:hypothetical protein